MASLEQVIKDLQSIMDSGGTGGGGGASANARKAAAEGAVNDARQAMIGGIGDIAGGVASAAMGGETPEVKTP